MATAASHRVRKMQRTRARIVEVAETLFREQGYKETTIAQIAEGADVSPATVYNYFGSKDDILFADHDRLQRDLASWLEARPAGTSTIEATCSWASSRRRELRSVESDRLHREIVDASPALRAKERLRMSFLEELLAREVGRDLGEMPGALRPRIVAAAITAVVLASFQYGVAHTPPDQDPYAELDGARAFLRGGFEAVR